MKRVGGGVVLLCFYVRCVFFCFFFSSVCAWNSSLTGCIFVRKDKEDSTASLKKKKKLFSSSYS